VMPTSVEDVLDSTGDGSSVVDDESVGAPLVIPDDGIDVVVPPAVVVDSDGMPLVISTQSLTQ
jgi:hypothetical protein